MLSNAYFLAKFRFDTAENESANNLQILQQNTCYFCKLSFCKKKTQFFLQNKLNFRPASGYAAGASATLPPRFQVRRGRPRGGPLREADRAVPPPPVHFSMVCSNSKVERIFRNGYFLVSNFFKIVLIVRKPCSENSTIFVAKSQEI